MSSYSHAGVSKLDGEFKVRFANDTMRTKVLMKSGHEDVRLADLEYPYTKLECAKRLLTLEEFSDAIAQATITEYIEDNSPLLETIEKAVKSGAVKAPKAVKVTEDENTSF